MTHLNDKALAAIEQVKHRYEIAALVKPARLDLGLSQRQLAKKLAVSVASVRGWESGNHAPSGVLLNRVESWLAAPRPAKPMDSVHVFASSFDDGGLVLVSHDQETFEKMVRKFVIEQTREVGLPVEDIPEDFDEMLDYWDSIAPAANTTAFEYEAGDKQLSAPMA